MGAFVCGTVCGSLLGSATSAALEEYTEMGFVLEGGCGFAFGCAAENLLLIKESLDKGELVYHQEQTSQ